MGCDYNIEGFWRVLKDRIGAGRCFPDLHQLYQRTRRVLTDHQARPIYEFHEIMPGCPTACGGEEWHPC